MFTGLVEDVGEVVSISPQGDGRRLAIRTSIPLAEVAIGASIAVDGACLTAEVLRGDVFEVVAGRETLVKTTVGTFSPGRKVHLERALRVGDRLGGHLVQGHVDGVGTITDVAHQRESVVLWVRLPEGLARYVAAKGSLCVDGVSLTVNEVDGTRARLNIVPHTAEVTRMGRFRAGDPVNVEVDILAKYVERLLGVEGGVTLDLLQRNGFAP